MKQKLSFKELYAKFLAGTITPNEEAELWTEFMQQGENAELENTILKELKKSPPIGWEDQEKVREALNRVENKIFSTPIKREQKKSLSFKWLQIAATIILALSISIYFILNNDKIKSVDSLTSTTGNEDIPPAVKRASVVLSNGTTLELDEAEEGIVIAEDVHYRDGRKALKNPVKQEVTIQTPRGGTYQVTLSDGTRVWLNAESKIVYNPSSPLGNRTLYLEGEAYLEVQKDTENPFIVNTKNQSIQVLGTKFNVSAYPEDIRTVTTLVDGLVDVYSALNDEESQLFKDPEKQAINCVRLYPGEQSQLINNVIDKRLVDVSTYIAWKQGLITFKNDQLEHVIKKIERWYDVEFEVKNWPENMTIDGEVPSDIKLSGILKVLELYTNKKLKIIERRVIEVN